VVLRRRGAVAAHRYTLDQHGEVLRADIHHLPWPLRTAEAAFGLNTMAEPYGLELDEPPALLHFARRQNVLIWPLGGAQPASTAAGISAYSRKNSSQTRM
jgi:hypothetical protein